MESDSGSEHRKLTVVGDLTRVNVGSTVTISLVPCLNIHRPDTKFGSPVLGVE